jgi:hypothetical protein
MNVQAMLDLEGNNAVSESEFLAVAKDFVEIERLGANGVAAEEVRWCAYTCMQLSGRYSCASCVPHSSGTATKCQCCCQN